MPVSKLGPGGPDHPVDALPEDGPAAVSAAPAKQADLAPHRPPPSASSYRAEAGLAEAVLRGRLGESASWLAPSESSAPVAPPGFVQEPGRVSGRFAADPAGREAQAEEILRSYEVAPQPGRIYAVQIDQEGPPVPANGDEAAAVFEGYIRQYTGEMVLFQADDGGRLRELNEDGPFRSASHPGQLRGQVGGGAGLVDVGGEARADGRNADMAHLRSGVYDFSTETVEYNGRTRYPPSSRLPVHRDTSQDGVIDAGERAASEAEMDDVGSNLSHAGGIQIHDGNDGAPSSAGCQTLHPADYDDFRAVVDDRAASQGGFTYVLARRPNDTFLGGSVGAGDAANREGDIRTIQDRLVGTGDLVPGTYVPGTITEGANDPTVGAIRQFQGRHGIVGPEGRGDGVIGVGGPTQQALMQGPDLQASPAPEGAAPLPPPASLLPPPASLLPPPASLLPPPASPPSGAVPGWSETAPAAPPAEVEAPPPPEGPPFAPFELRGRVGQLSEDRGGNVIFPENYPDDVERVQERLVAFGALEEGSFTPGKSDPPTLDAIVSFQRERTGGSDGRVDPDGPLHRALMRRAPAEGAAAPPAIAQALPDAAAPSPLPPTGTGADGVPLTPAGSPHLVEGYPYGPFELRDRVGRVSRDADDNIIHPENYPEDVLAVRVRLEALGYLPETADAARSSGYDEELGAAIQGFQFQNNRSGIRDGRIDPRGQTHRNLEETPRPHHAPDGAPHPEAFDEALANRAERGDTPIDRAWAERMLFGVIAGGGDEMEEASDKRWNDVFALDGGTVGIAHFAGRGLGTLYDAMGEEGLRDTFASYYEAETGRTWGGEDSIPSQPYECDWWYRGMRDFLRPENVHVQIEGFLGQAEDAIRIGREHGFTTDRQFAIASGIRNSRLGTRGLERLGEECGWDAERMLEMFPTYGLDAGEISGHRLNRVQLTNEVFPP